MRNLILILLTVSTLHAQDPIGRRHYHPATGITYIVVTAVIDDDTRDGYSTDTGIATTEDINNAAGGSLLGSSTGGIDVELGAAFSLGGLIPSGTTLDSAYLVVYKMAVANVTGSQNVSINAFYLSEGNVADPFDASHTHRLLQNHTGFGTTYISTTKTWSPINATGFETIDVKAMMQDFINNSGDLPSSAYFGVLFQTSDQFGVIINDYSNGNHPRDMRLRLVYH